MRYFSEMPFTSSGSCLASLPFSFSKSHRHFPAVDLAVLHGIFAGFAVFFAFKVHKAKSEKVMAGVREEHILRITGGEEYIYIFSPLLQYKDYSTLLTPLKLLYPYLHSLLHVRPLQRHSEESLRSFSRQGPLRSAFSVRLKNKKIDQFGLSQFVTFATIRLGETFTLCYSLAIV